MKMWQTFICTGSWVQGVPRVQGQRLQLLVSYTLQRLCGFSSWPLWICWRDSQVSVTHVGQEVPRIFGS